MRLVHSIAASAAIIFCAGAVNAASLAGQSIDGVLSSNQTPGVTTQFTSPVVDPGVFNGVMQDVFGQVWDVTVDVLPTSFTINFVTPNNVNGNVASNGLLNIDLSGFTGAPTFGLTSYSCVPAGSFACTTFGGGPTVSALSSTSTDFNVTFDVMRTGETYTFGTAVPEPSAWALMLLGFGGLGVAMRSRRKVVEAAI